MTVRQTILAAAIAVALCGCTTTADLKAPINGFKDAATAASTSLQTYDKMLNDVALARSTEIALKDGGTVFAVGDGCKTRAKQCHLAVKGKDGQTYPLDSSTPIDPEARLIMAGIVTYANNLATIASIDETADVKSATDGSLAQIGQLAKDIDGVTKDGNLGTPTALAAQVASYTTPISDATVFVLSAAVEQKKLLALRAATKAMNVILAPSLEVCAASVHAGVIIQKLKLFQTYSSAFDAYQLAVNSKRADAADRLDALRQTAAALDAALALDPSGPFPALAAAHDKLTVALSNDKPDFKAVWAALQQVLADAGKVQTIVAEFQTAAKTPAQ